MPFDLEAARKAGKSDDDIASYLGSSLGFDVNAAKKSGKSSTDIAEYLASHDKQPAQSPPVQRETQVPKWGRDNPNLYGAAGAAYEVGKPIVEALGFAGGAAIGAGAGGSVGSAAGAGLGYAGARALTSAAGQALGVEEPKNMLQQGKQAIGDVATGAEMEAGGQVAGKAIGKGIELAGKGIKQVLGASTGAGPGMVDEALKGSNAFKDAMRGKTSGDEIVDNAAQALQSLKEQRTAEYTSKLAKISESKEPIDISPIKDKFSRLLKQYGVKEAEVVTQMNTGEQFDFSRSVFGKSASRDVKEIADIVGQWGTKEGDNTPMMLDTLKRRLDDFYSDSSQARQLVTAMRNEVKDAIVKNVPEYSNMTKGYAEATNLIKDVESGLMLRKQGMSGRITADQTLRRLSSAMRENFEMRRDLVNILGEKSGRDLSGQVGGYAASSIIPRGLVGKLAGGSAGYLAYLHPNYWPILAASSPRVVGEFLNIYGKGLVSAKIISPAIYKTLAFEASKALEGSSDKEKEQFVLDNMNKAKAMTMRLAPKAIENTEGVQ